MTPAFLSVSNSLWNQVVCFKGRLYGFCKIGRLFLASMSIVTRSVCPKSLELDEKNLKISKTKVTEFVSDILPYLHIL